MKGKGLPKLSKRVICVIEPVFQKRGNESSTECICRAFSTFKDKLIWGERELKRAPEKDLRSKDFLGKRKSKPKENADIFMSALLKGFALTL